MKKGKEEGKVPSNESFAPTVILELSFKNQVTGSSRDPTNCDRKVSVLSNYLIAAKPDTTT